MSNFVIRAAFEDRLKTWADARSIPVAWEGVQFVKPTQGTFLEPYLLPAPTLNKELSGQRKTYIGIFQINCWALSGKGTQEVEQLAHDIASHFPHMTKIGSVSIEKTPDVERPHPDTSGWIIVPVTIQYRMESTS